MNRSLNVNSNNREEIMLGEGAIDRQQAHAKTTFIADGIEAEIENCYLQKSLYIYPFLQNVEPNEVNHTEVIEMQTLLFIGIANHFASMGLS